MQRRGVLEGEGPTMPEKEGNSEIMRGSNETGKQFEGTAKKLDRVADLRRSEGRGSAGFFPHMSVQCAKISHV